MDKKTRAWLIGAAALGAAASFGPTAFAGCGGDAVLKQPVAYQDSAAPIVGMWSFTQYVNSGVFDFGYAVWHSDGTEIMNSGSRAPASGNFCLGVWKQLGSRRFGLNHYALGYDPATGKLNGKVNLKEDVTIDSSGNNFIGTFVEDIYDPQSGTRVGEIKGSIVAQRIMP